MRSRWLYEYPRMATVAFVALAIGISIAEGGYVAFVSGAAVVAALIVLVWPRTAPAHAEVGVRQVLLASTLVLYVIPMLMFGRAFALIGVSPVYLPDVLLILAALMMIPEARFGSIAPLPLLCTLIALFALHAVYVGQEHGYEAADKGLVLALYPMIAVAVAAWIAGRGQTDRVISFLPRYALPLVAVGLAIVILANVPYVAASYGLYLGIAAAFAAAPGVPNRGLLLVSTLAGFMVLVSVNAERGPTLTILLASLASWLTSTRFRSTMAAAGRVLTVTIIVTAAALFFSLGFAPGTDVPVVGRLAIRVASADTAESLSAANNVSLRKAIWSYALSTTYHQDPLLGVGAYHPIELTYLGNNLRRDADTGVHNSFVGYTFYAGYLAGLLVIAVFSLGLYRVWQVRHRNIYAPAVFGALVAVIVTALTNVALETTYIGGPSWAALGLAVGLAAKTRSRENRARP